MEEGGAVCGRGCGVKDDLVLSFLISKIKKISNCVSRSVMSDSVNPWTVARQAPLSMGFPRQEYWSGLPFPSLQGIFLTQGLSPGLLHCRHIIYCLSPQAKKFKKPVKDTRNCWVIKPMVQ